MALSIVIRRAQDDANRVVYRYEQPIYGRHPSKPERLVEIGRQFGEVALDKRSGEIEWLCGNDWDEKEVIFDRVCFKLAQCWQQGSYPELLHWAS
jgi:hypothetical protein